MRDKDGISAAVLACDMVAALRTQGLSVLDALDALARQHGVHTTAAVTRRVDSPQQAAEIMTRLRHHPPASLGGFDLTVTDLHPRTDALVFTGGDDSTTLRVVVRPSGTEPKLKCYLEIRCDGELDTARARAAELQNAAAEAVRDWGQRGPN